uniref:(northern house mosquito) hypothetical protein n=1 Tax=Culex pipiens TaxID=7175 RepID=A0A8D8C3J2_CULPI
MTDVVPAYHLGQILHHVLLLLQQLSPSSVLFKTVQLQLAVTLNFRKAFRNFAQNRGLELLRQQTGRSGTGIQDDAPGVGSVWPYEGHVDRMDVRLAGLLAALVVLLGHLEQFHCAG